MSKRYGWDIFVGTTPQLCQCCFRRSADLVQTNNETKEQRLYCAECVKDGLAILKGKEPCDKQS